MKSVTRTKRVFFAVNKDANSPAFIERAIEFDWYMGMNWQIRLKSSKAMHESILEINPNAKILEVSTKSDNYALGKALSAFNLRINDLPVENFFQASKVFSDGGPYLDLLEMKPSMAKKDTRITNKRGRVLTAFVLDGKKYPTEPKSFFYDYLYISALSQNHSLLDKITEYDTFTDIEFNQKVTYAEEKGPFNCQARACAICVWLMRNRLLNEYLVAPERFIERIYPTKLTQGVLF